MELRVGSNTHLHEKAWDDAVEDLVVEESRGNQVEQAVDTQRRECAIDLHSEVAR
jgi:hypothetical protein